MLLHVRLTVVFMMLLAAAGCGEDAQPKSSDNNNPSKAGCGNARIDTGEICDQTALAGQTCAALVGTSGVLKCLADCSAYDVSTCAGPISCGNNVLDPGELCDGELLGAATCQALGFAGGTLTCAANCLNRDTLGCTTAICTPDCSGRVCGPDPECGVSCGSCATGSCNNSGQCGDICTPDCSGRVCGPDPACGVSCGSCATGTCNSAGTCEAECTPNCGLRVCGVDPLCGTSCGTCADGVCTIFGTCAVGCTPDCEGRACGPDPVCATSCGECGDNSFCNILDGTCTSICTPNCSNRECGPDPMCGTSCGSCDVGTCNSAGSCIDTASPGIVVRLTWDTILTDLDLHMRRNADTLCSVNDCYASHKTPDWDSVAGVSTGDPALDADVTMGLGPETISLPTPGTNTYVVSVHYVATPQATVSTTATIEVILQGDSLVFTKVMNAGERWDAVRIAWSNGAGSVMPIDSIQTGWSCTNNTTLSCLTDADCPNLAWPETQYCNLTLGIAGSCASGCRQSDDCPSALACTGAHQCAPATDLGGWQDPCTDSNSCKGGLYCNPLFNTCSESCTPPTHACTENISCCPMSQAAYCQDLLGLWAYCTDSL